MANVLQTHFKIKEFVQKTTAAKTSRVGSDSVLGNPSIQILYCSIAEHT